MGGIPRNIIDSLRVSASKALRLVYIHALVGIPDSRHLVDTDRRQALTIAVPGDMVHTMGAGEAVVARIEGREIGNLALECQ